MQEQFYKLKVHPGSKAARILRKGPDAFELWVKAPAERGLANAAAIAHAEVAELYGLNPLYSNIEDSPNNVTRFYVLSKSFSSPSGKDETAIMCYIKNQVGALYDILRPFKKYAVNLTSIESLPSRRKAWDYSFYIELEGHVQDENIKKALEKVSRVCLELKVLGSFPRGNQFS